VGDGFVEGRILIFSIFIKLFLLLYLNIEQKKPPVKEEKIL
jgi:hypothetical protein